MSKLNGHYGVVDDSHNSERSIFSLKLTDRALNDIQEYMTRGNKADLRIKFHPIKNGASKGEIRFPDNKWNFTAYNIEPVDAIRIGLKIWNFI